MVDGDKLIPGPRTAAEVVAAVERQISGGDLSPGDRMPPVRDLAARLGLAPATVGAAYRMLGSRGSLVGRGRRGTFVTDRPALTQPAPPPAVTGLTDLSRGNPDPRHLPDVTAAVAAAAALPPVGYGDPPVDARLAGLLADDLAADGVDPGHLCVVGGALDGVERVLGAWLRPGDRVATEDPGYGPMLQLVGAMGFTPVGVPLDDRGPTVEGREAVLGGPGGAGGLGRSGVAAVVVTPRAQNPTGAAVDGGRAADLAAVLAARPGTLVVVDDHAGAVAGAPFRWMVGTERWATIRSMAKVLGPDLRVAVVAGDAVTVGRVAGRQALGTGWVPHLLQRTVAELLSHPGLGNRLASAAADLEGRRRLVIDRLAAAGVAATGRSGFNVWVPVDDEARVVAAMQHRGFVLRPGAGFRLASGPGVRLTVTGHGPDVLAAAADALASVVSDRAGVRIG
ncbi:MAG: aminotransferase class I/II-fold pyridoxal phosphate-dependent enzyme [Acidimicrobiales bacterium]